MKILITQKRKVYTVNQNQVTKVREKDFKEIVPEIIKDSNDIKQVIEHAKETNLTVNQAIENYKLSQIEASENSEINRALFNANLNNFWKDVDSRIGMDVCTPFINKFSGHSFVSYDKGFVWSKTQSTIYKLRSCSASFLDYPKQTKKIVQFGQEF